MTTPRVKDNDLLPCPFCGSDAEWNLGRTGDDKPWRYIACTDCEAMGPHLTEPASDDRKIAAWNRRAALQASE